MFNWNIKESPILSLLGMGGGAGSNLTGGASDPQLNFVYFYSSGSWTVPSDTFSATEGGTAGTVNVLVVGGGGGAGFNAASAGGGAGGFRYATTYTIPAPAGSTVPLTVGTGGLPALDYAGGASENTGTKGGNSTFAPGTPYAITATGGGGGGQNNNPPDPGMVTRGAGGSGAGGACGEAGSGLAGSAGNEGGNVSSPPFSQAAEGYPGGTGANVGPASEGFAGGGGGGAGGAGGANGPYSGGNGGPGAQANMYVDTSLAPSPGVIYQMPVPQGAPLIAATYYAGGGAGGSQGPVSNGGTGGQGGGGNNQNAGSSGGSPNGGTDGYGGGAAAPRNSRTRNVADNPAQAGGHGCVILTYYTS